MWLQRKIRPLWTSIASKNRISTALRGQIEGYLNKLGESFYVGINQNLIDKIDILSEELKRKWTELAYNEINRDSNGLVKDYIDLLDKTKIDIPHKKQTLKNFIYFKGLIELLPEIENKLNNQIEILKNGVRSGKQMEF